MYELHPRTTGAPERFPVPLPGFFPVLFFFKPMGLAPSGAGRLQLEQRAHSQNAIDGPRRRRRATSSPHTCSYTQKKNVRAVI